MTGQERTPEEELEHWRSELARVVKASPDMPWPVLIEWAEEDELVATKAATRSGRAKLVGIEQRLAAMEKLAAAWQKEAERARKDLADQAYPDDSVEFVAWSALDRPLEEVDMVAILKTIRHCRLLAAEALHVCAGTWQDAKKRLTDLHAPVQHMGRTWCRECSVRRRTGPRDEEWVAYIPHPCPTLDTLESKEPTT
ncbi:hypothetical protein [Streptomyces prasinopilosus]|uniref:hypothetical protein n=1 Tax=Streptomyces prasinopilosus TaxID=67344 RepID=UPI0006EB6A29|nr:hypothetical protein [Streptomyces prasinopilosus]